ncbi:hypothetical protein DXG03_008284 [Asterophora parasitica]|uniref:Retrotransposon gag domain-containing protein n=1 Tax=Asterophora parasitica TaxID=117018 RepID=A0A9P7G1U4_9AGAR|nr:hypothetical protein DXG03_008284 [Asterophora parasitica]
MSHSSPPDQSASDAASSSPSNNHEAWRCLLAVEQKLQDLTMFQTNTASALQNIMQQLANVAATLQNMSTVPPASQANPQALAALVGPPNNVPGITSSDSPSKGITQVASWDDFCNAFVQEFYELDVEVTTSLALESESYYQHKCDIDVYIDSFQSLYWKAGYPDRCHLVMKFHHGLSKRISDCLGNITTGRPNDTCVEAWMTAVRKQAFIMKTEADFSWGWLAAKPAKRTPTAIPGRIPITLPRLPLVFTNLAPF